MEIPRTSTCNVIYRCIISVLFTGLLCSAQLEVKVNDIETATDGDASTSLSCSFSGYSGTPATIILAWEKTDTETGQKQFLIQQFNGYPETIGRYTIEGQANLRIAGPITVDDVGRYTCKVSLIGGGAGGTQQASVELLINSPIQDLVMGVEGQIDLLGENDVVTMIESQPITIICWAKQANPAASVTWYLGDQMIVSGEEGFTIESHTEEVDQPGDSRLNTVSQLTFSPIYTQHQNKVLMCSAINDIMSDELSLSVYPRILVPPSNHYIVGYESGDMVPVVEGQVFTISCRAVESYPVTQLQWYLDGAPIEHGITANNVQNDDGRVTVMSTWTYMASRAKGDDGARVQCVASGEPLSATNSVYVTLDILYPPTEIGITGDSDHYKAGEPARGIVCSSSGGRPAPKVSWWLGNQEKVTGVLNSNYLDLEMTANDNGKIYTCLANNDANIGHPLRMDTAPLNILFPPACVMLTGEGAVVTGQEATLTCSVCSSNPAASTYWKKDNGIITGSTTERLQATTYSKGENKGQITEQKLILKVTPSYNGVKIQCFGRNHEFDNIETSSDKYELDVLFPPVYPNGCVTSLTGYRAPLKAGDSLTLLCTSCSSNPAATIRWYRDDEEVQGTNQDMLTDGLYNGQVTAQEITMVMSQEHHGSQYHCSAFNRMVPNVPAPSQKITLEVQYKPMIINHELNRKAAASSGEEARLHCQVNSNPSPQVYWFHDNKRVISDGFYYTVTIVTNGAITTSTLYISSVDPLRDYGTFNCTTNNSHGMDSFLIDMQGKTKPDSAVGVEVIHMTDTMVTVTWQPGFDGGERQLFYLKYRIFSQDGSHEWMTSSAVIEPPLVARDLDSSTQYEILVISENSLGSSESNTIVRQTMVSNVGTTSPQKDSRSTIGVPIGVAMAILAAVIIVIAIIVIICKNRKSRKSEKPATVRVSSFEIANRQQQNDLSLTYFTSATAPPNPPLRTVSVVPNNLAYDSKAIIAHPGQENHHHKRHYPEEEAIYSEVPFSYDMPDDDEAPPSYHGNTPPSENALADFSHQIINGLDGLYQNRRRDRMPTPSTSHSSKAPSPSSSGNESSHISAISNDSIYKDTPYRTHTGIYV
ncbi:nephrin-like isoform X2 [Ptychodera flava]|uniref:nephrin-like isoform X2 n=1 Tax=Ptychodera flava TaxID=63121 RepID=UPI00396A6450